jgi:predicted nucleic acid-binding protein
MPFVLDASIAACRAFEDAHHPTAALALERIRTDEALVPCIWWFEVRNTLIANERRGRLSETDAAIFLRALSRLGVTIDRAPDSGTRPDAPALRLRRALSGACSARAPAARHLGSRASQGCAGGRHRAAGGAVSTDLIVDRDGLMPAR